MQNMDPPIMQPTTFYILGRSLSWLYYSNRHSDYFPKISILVRGNIRPNSSTILELLTDELLIKNFKKRWSNHEVDVMSNHIILESLQSQYLKQREENKTNKNISFRNLFDDNEEIWFKSIYKIIKEEIWLLSNQF